MSSRVGRKPLATAHVDHLYGSIHAKDRMRMFLETLRGELTIPDACKLLSLSEAQFHHVRNKWMQESLELLEPRSPGRPAKAVDPAAVIADRDRLAAEVAALREQLRGAAVRAEIERILNDPSDPPVKKNDGEPSPSPASVRPKAR